MRKFRFNGAVIGAALRMAHIGNCLGLFIQKESNMNKDQVFGVVRTLAAAGFGYLAGKGLIDGATAEALAGAIATIGVAIWSVVSKQPVAESAE
jgi:hypothetical protein